MVIGAGVILKDSCLNSHHLDWGCSKSWKPEQLKPLGPLFLSWCSLHMIFPRGHLTVTRLLTQGLEGSQMGYQKRKQQNWHGFLPQKSPSITSITLLFKFNHCIYFILYFIWGSHKGQPSLKWRKSTKGFVTCFKTTRHNAGPIYLRSHGGLNTASLEIWLHSPFFLKCYSSSTLIWNTY